MAYKSPIPADSNYIFALGQAIYSFSTLEWMVVWVAEKVAPGFINKDHHTMTAGQISRQFREAVVEAKDRLPDDLWMRLKTASDDLWHAVDLRKDLLHAHPFTAEGSEQRLGRRQASGSFTQWDIEKIDAATRYFDQLNQELNDLFHHYLA